MPDLFAVGGGLVAGIFGVADGGVEPFVIDEEAAEPMPAGVGELALGNDRRHFVGHARALRVAGLVDGAAGGEPEIPLEKLHALAEGLVGDESGGVVIDAARILLAEGEDDAEVRLGHVEGALVVQAEEARVIDPIGGERDAVPRPHPERRHARPHRP